jgi:mono/diheme cytochrome c family protein
MKSGTAYSIVMLAIAWAPFAADSNQKSIQLPPDNAMAELKRGRGVEVARANCVACHSTDYIVRQPGRDTKQWEAEVKKMITVFGAPISNEDAAVIVEYLASAYGPDQKPASPPGSLEPPGEKKPQSKKLWLRPQLTGREPSLKQRCRVECFS